MGDKSPFLSIPRYSLAPGVGFAIDLPESRKIVPVRGSVSYLRQVAAALSSFITGDKRRGSFSAKVSTDANILYDIWKELGGRHCQIPASEQGFNNSRAVPTDCPKTLNFRSLSGSERGLREPSFAVDVQDLRKRLGEHGLSLRIPGMSVASGSTYANFLDVIHTRTILTQDGKVIAEGKGLNPETAEISALAEAVERLVAQSPDHSQIMYGKSSQEMKMGSFDVPELEPGDRDLFTEELRIDWMPAKKYPNGEAWVPAEKVWHIYPPLTGIYAFDMRTTIGLAAGSTVEEAFANGLLEVIEKDAYAVMMRCKLTCPDITPEEIAQCDPEVVALLDRLEQAGIDVHLKWISLDWPVPIAHAFLLDREERIPAHSHGCSAAFSPSIAIARAIVESIQVYNGLARNAQMAAAAILTRQTTNHSDAKAAWSDPLYRPHLKHLFAPRTDREWEFGTPWISGQIDDLGDLCDFAHNRGYNIFHCVLGEIGGLKVVRVLMENTVIPDSRIENCGNRLGTWVRKLGLPSPFSDLILT